MSNSRREATWLQQLCIHLQVLTAFSNSSIHRALVAMLALALLTGVNLSAAAKQASSETRTPAVLITHGPVVESTSERSAVIAWSTNLSSGTVVRYGVDANHLDARAEMPWGGYTHRVTLRNLQSDTIYFFQVSSPDAAGGGGSVSSDVLQFTTKL